MTDTSTRSPERGGAGAEDEIPRPHSFEELPAYVWAKAAHGGAKEVPVKKDDHGADCLRYAVAWADGIGRGAGFFMEAM